MGAVIMLGTLFGLIVLIFGLVLRFDPEADVYKRQAWAAAAPAFVSPASRSSERLSRSSRRADSLPPLVCRMPATPGTSMIISLAVQYNSMILVCHGPVLGDGISASTVSASSSRAARLPGTW